MRKHKKRTEQLVWNGLTLEVSYDPKWMSVGRSITAHLEVRSLAPEAEPLPITETGYRSYFCTPEEIDAQGGATAYVTAWLDHEARSPKWKAADLARRQLSLF